MLPTASAEHYTGQREVMISVLGSVRQLWGTRPPKDFDAWFDKNLDRLMAVLVAGQRAASADADEYVGNVLDELGTPVPPEAELVTDPLIGVASDGRGLDSLMYGPVITAKSGVASGWPVELAWEAGMQSLLVRAQTQIADASRAAVGLGIAARRDVGYVRMLNPPSCSRCAVLAGKWYASNRGFARHPGCDCRHIPARENSAGDLRTDPSMYFDSLTAEQQDKLFTKAGAAAIRDGADITQVVNARRGMSTAQQNVAGWIPKGRLSRTEVYGQRIATTTEGITRRGVAYRSMSQAGYARRQTDVRNGRRYFQARAPRLMPEGIYEIAEDRDDALRLLRLYGYLSDRPNRGIGGKPVRPRQVPASRAPETASGGGGGKPPVPPRMGHDSPMPDDEDPLDGIPFPHEYTLYQDDALLTAAERQVIADYTLSGYRDINEALRGRREMTPEIAEQIRTLRSAISKYPLDKTWRTSRETEAEDLGLTSATISDDIVGEFLSEAGFLSTSGLKNPPKIVDRKDPVVLDILVPEGTPALLLTEKLTRASASEREVLLLDGRELYIFGVKFDSDLGLWRIAVRVENEGGES
ncbi:hypothetical protein M1M07_07670 [Rhodococcus sp. HM1]|uniref:ADP-ribosyltransferase n=1 Tax=Rhodococcus sp. HM1 TaxID=2937759 RepID=UPI00200AAC29|nr:ADP-ribosyltransferase [Rhodococcus sp. HM1]MCK8670995.1 hypothetical protein [Rhodococcus sp. HM1]